MRFISKLIFIWNCCFLASVVLRYIESNNRKAGDNGALIPLPALEGSLVVLGYTAIFVNMLYFIIALFTRMAGKGWPAPKWIFWFNFLMLPLQVYYFIFFKA